VDALRRQWDGEAAQLRGELARERDAGAALSQRLTEAERGRSAAVLAKGEAEARLEGKLETCRADRDELRHKLEAARADLARTAGARADPERTKAPASARAP